MRSLVPVSEFLILLLSRCITTRVVALAVAAPLTPGLNLVDCCGFSSACLTQGHEERCRPRSRPTGDSAGSDASVLHATCGGSATAAYQPISPRRRVTAVDVLEASITSK